MSNAKLELFHEEVIPRLENAVVELDKLAASYASRGDLKNVARLNAKSAAVTKVLTEQSERLLAVKTVDDGLMVAALFLARGKADGAHEGGTSLAYGYVTDFLRG